MSTKVVAVCFLVGFLSCASAQTCPCVESDPDANCRVTREVAIGRCQEVTQPCAGCVCDLSGTQTCAIATRNTLIVGPGNTCDTTSSDVVLCPPSGSNSGGSSQGGTTNQGSSGGIGLGQVEATCTVSGPTATQLTCNMACFDENIGTLTGFTLGHEVSFEGAFQVTNEQGGGASGVSISQTASLVADGLANGLSFIKIEDIDLRPNLTGISLGAGETISETTSGSTQSQETLPIDGEKARYLLCSSSNGGTPQSATLGITGSLATDTLERFRTTSQGIVTVKLTAIFSFTAAVP